MILLILQEYIIVNAKKKNLNSLSSVRNEREILQLQNIILLVVNIKVFIDDSFTVHRGLSNNRIGKALNTLLYCPLYCNHQVALFLI